MVDKISVRYLIFILIFISCSKVLRGPAQLKQKHIVFDLDHTLVAEIEEGETFNPKRTITIQGIHYRIIPYARELITELSKREDVSISFFSGGSEDRNLELLKLLKLSDGSDKSFHDISYRILSKRHLYDNRKNVPEDSRFVHKWKKDISLVSDDLDSIILVDDHKDFYYQGQKNNTAWLGEWFNNFESYSDVEDYRKRIGDAKGFRLPPSYKDWWMNRNKLALVGSAIEEALDNDEVFVESMRIHLKHLDEQRAGSLESLKDRVHTFGIRFAPESCSSALGSFLQIR